MCREKSATVSPQSKEEKCRYVTNDSNMFKTY